MNWKEKLTKSCNLYLILDADVHAYDDLVAIADKAIAGGVDIVQLRAKHGNARDILACAKKIKNITDKKVPFIINDRVDLAIAAGADGVHLGQEDLPIAQARCLLANNMIIGTSCQNLEHIRQAKEDKVDYIGFGSVFKTLTKPERNPMNLELLKKAVCECDMPMYAIGGISLDSLDSILDLGVKRIAVCRAISKAEDVQIASEKFKNLLQERQVSSFYA